MKVFVASLSVLAAMMVGWGCGGGTQQTTDRAGQDIKDGAKTTAHDVETVGAGHGDAGSLNSH